MKLKGTLMKLRIQHYKGIVSLESNLKIEFVPYQNPPRLLLHVQIGKLPLNVM